MPSTHVKIWAIRSAEKQFEVFDERGLYLFIKPDGLHLWRVACRHARDRRRRGA